MRRKVGAMFVLVQTFGKRKPVKCYYTGQRKPHPRSKAFMVSAWAENPQDAVLFPSENMARMHAEAIDAKMTVEPAPA
jgi:hypothetical protein